jgi:hypothetical protein
MEFAASQTGIYVFTTIAALLVIGIGGYIWLYTRKTRHQRHIVKVLKALELKYVKDIVLPDGVDGWVFIDYLLLVPNGVVVLDIHSSEGHLFGGKSVDQWSQVINHKTYKFANPLYANQTQCQAVIWNMAQQKEQHSENPEDWQTFGRIVFSNAGNFPKGIPSQVSMIDDLKSDLEKLTDITQPAGEPIRQMWDKLCEISQSTRADLSR